MQILSLFNGISCGRVALQRANIPVERYVSFETDKYANMVAKTNFPNDEYYADVFEGDYTKFKDFDLLLGGSPCTTWSIAKNGRETTSSGVGWELFMQYVRALKESGCKWFLYENNHSIHKDIKAAITKELGVEHIMINSALVSAQNRERCYWTNIPNVTQPGDKGILLKDIIESGVVDREKSYCLTHVQGNARDYFKKHQTQVVFESVDYKPHKNSSIVITDNSMRLKRHDKNHSTIQGSHVHFPHSKTQTVSVSHIPKVFEPVSDIQGQRIYTVKDKKVYLVSDKYNTTGYYDINLPDGDYIIRKLTVRECCRLQTLPDDYFIDGNADKIVSDTQAYKGLGNGWTVDVIAHILKGIKQNQSLS